MNGPQHYASAEDCLAKGLERRSPMLMDAAMVHATLALAAATALPAAPAMPVPDCDAWEAAVSIATEAIREDAGKAPATPIYDAMTGQPPAGPLVTCGAEDSDPDNDGGPCGLPIGHGPEIPHDNGAGWTWRNDSDYAALADAPAPIPLRCGLHGGPAKVTIGEMLNKGPCPECNPQAEQTSLVRPYAANL